MATDIDKILKVIDPFKVFTMQQQEQMEEEDQTPMADGSAQVLKFVVRLIEQWRYLPVYARNGGVMEGKYLGDIIEEQIAAEAICAMIEHHFKPSMRLEYQFKGYPREKQSPTKALERTEREETASD